MSGIKDIYYALKIGYHSLLWVGGKLKWLIFNALAFPNSALWFRIPLWLLWLILLTKPKQIREGGNKLCEWIHQGAGYVHSGVWKSPLVGILLLLFASPIPIAAFILKVLPPKFSRFVLIIGICNFLVSDVLLGTPFSEVAKKYFGWEMPPDFMLADLKIMWVLSALTAIILFFVWWLTRDETDKKKARKLRSKHGWIKGAFILLWDDLFSGLKKTPTKWVCGKCDHENPIEEGEEPAVVCDNCGSLNPSAKWKCQKQGCRTINKPGTKRCSKCSTPRQGQDDDQDLDICPNCDHEQEAGSDFCGNCGYEFESEETDEDEPAPAGPAPPAPRPRRRHIPGID